MDDDNDNHNEMMDLLNLIRRSQNISPDDMLPCLSSKDIKRIINDDKNKNKLIILLFIESSSPAINIFHMKLSPIPKKTRMALAYYVDIKQDQSVISDYKLKQSITTIMFKSNKEQERFEGMINQDVLTWIDEHTPMDPFAGGGHKITDIGTVDTEAYLKSVRRPKQAPPPEPQKKPKKHSRFDDFVINNKLDPQVPQNSSVPPAPPSPSQPIIPFMDPFSEEYENLKNDLKDVTYDESEIELAIIAGCGEFNECSDYIESVRNNQPNSNSLTYPGFKINNLSPEQHQIYDSLKDDLDKAQILYILLYTGTTDEDSLMEYLSDAADHLPIPSQQSHVALELQRILGQDQIPQQSFSRTAPPPSNDSEYFDAFKQAQKEIEKEVKEAKKKRNDELRYKQQTLNAIRAQRENAKREWQAEAKSRDLSKTTPISAIPASPKVQANGQNVTIRFRLPNGTTAQYVFNPTDTFETIERKLKDDNHIKEDDVIELNAVPSPRICRNDFGLQLQDKNIRGKVMMSIIVLQQAPAQQTTDDN